MKIVKENINFERGDPRKTLGLNQPTIEIFARILEEFDIHLVEGLNPLTGRKGYNDVDEDPADYGWEAPHWTSYSSYTFDVNDYIKPENQDTYLIIELLTDNKGEEFFEFYFDSNPFFGSALYYNPELQPISIFDGEIVVKIIKYLEENY